MNKNLFIFICLSLFLTTVQSFAANKEDIISSELKKIGAVLLSIDNFYVDSVNISEISEYAIAGMLDKLDPHSSYLSKDEKESSTEAFQGSFVGIGIQYRMSNDTLLVTNTISGCPAQKAGIFPNDQIIFVDKQNIAGAKKKNNEIKNLIRGKEGTAVALRIKRPGETELIDIDLKRAKIPIHSVEAFYMITPDIGYIKISRFGNNTIKEVDSALDKMEKKGMSKLIIDLENNGGGYLHTAVELTNLFLDENKLVVYTKGEKQKEQTFNTKKQAKYVSLPIAILINKYSASASEIFSGAVQDWDRGIIIGQRSFGKGLVQRPLPLHDGSEVRLTIARYYTPSGRYIQRPYEHGSSAYREEINNRHETSDSIFYTDSLTYKTLILNRTVYGGGGITPDYIVPIDSFWYDKKFYSIISKGILDKVVLSYFSNNKNVLKKEYRSFEHFNSSFSDENLIFSLKKEIDNESIEITESEWEHMSSNLNLRMKASIAEKLFENDSYFYQIMNQQNKSLQKAIEIFEKSQANNLLIYPQSSNLRSVHDKYE